MLEANKNKMFVECNTTYFNQGKSISIFINILLAVAIMFSED